ncbi:MAG: hypothetical protein JWM12_2301 [Ilumatobacteraceae bacterium]|nr:hypothetical protein [Ilumatobacteraceae bacterium]
MLPLRFVPYHLLDDTPNVVVDGSANAGTVLTLSHWPGSPTPVEVRADLSAQIALRALAHPGWFLGVDAVSNNHFDQDGLAAAYALTAPEAAVARAEQLIDVARAGDFATFETREGARLAMAIAVFADAARSPLDAATFAGTYSDQCGRLYEQLLVRLPGLLADPDSVRALWADEDAHLAASLAAIASGRVRIEEHPSIDLAIVTIPDHLVSDGAHRFAHSFTTEWTEAVHPMAVNNATAMLRVLLVQGRRYRLELRYESWVMLVSRRVMPRPDLRPLATRLTELEPGAAGWTADGPGSLTPFLRIVGDAESGIEPAVVVAEVDAFLAAAPAAWDPFHT